MTRNNTCPGLTWEDVCRLKIELDAMHLRILAIEHPHAAYPDGWRVAIKPHKRDHLYEVTSLQDWHAAIAAGKVPEYALGLLYVPPMEPVQTAPADREVYSHDA